MRDRLDDLGFAVRRLAGRARQWPGLAWRAITAPVSLKSMKQWDHLTRDAGDKPEPRITMFWDGSMPKSGSTPKGGLTLKQAADALGQVQNARPSIKDMQPQDEDEDTAPVPSITPPKSMDQLIASVQLTRGERVADKLTDRIGSWPFIIGLGVFLGTWFFLNANPSLPTPVWDPWPWMGANIIMSTLAAFATSFVIIAQKVGSRRDRAFWDLMVRMLTHNEQTADRVEAMARDISQIAQADHVEHGNLLRDLHSHTTCAGHTTIGAVEQMADQAADQVAGQDVQAELTEIKALLRMVLTLNDVTPDLIQEFLRLHAGDAIAARVAAEPEPAKTAPAKRTAKKAAR